ncbi:hypothetical protein SAMN02787073_4781 [Chryseobacterium vrystaatense]|uniref:Uncharacterized protein n=1 Tax=Chryseobacterium vrystaatense TaxID=307480 RepID=A0A1M5MAG6_9FLAO|nr:hypothetical protein SAMN02787073_4781 [Chryseobacterium vrystaatense]
MLMWIHCQIISDNPVIYNKIETFIKSAPCLFLQSEGAENNREQQIIFWDIDSKTIVHHDLEKHVRNGSVVIVISLFLPKDIILIRLGNEYRFSIGILTGQVSYTQFIEEISRIIDVQSKIKFPAD